MRRTLAGLLLLAFFGVFIQRGSFDLDGTRVYTLFDDAMISMRYAQNLAAGHGLTWNAGEAPVEGFTNPLWTFWMAVLHLLGVAPPAVGLLVSLSSAALVVATAFTMRALALHLAPGDHLSARLMFWGTATYYPLVYWSLRGMEVGLVTLLLAAAVLLALRLERQYSGTTLIGLAAVLSLAVLTRMELLAPSVFIVAFAAWRTPGRRAMVWVVPGLSLAIVLVLETALRLAYYGEWLPNTYYLKLGGVALGARLARGGVFLAVVSLMHLSGLLVLAAMRVRAQGRRFVPAEGLLLGLFVLLCAYSTWVGGDAWDFYAFANRFITPAVPFLMLVALLGVATLTRATATRAMYVAAALFLAMAAFDWLPLRAEETRPAAVRGLPALVTACCLFAAPRMIRRHGEERAQGLVATALLVGLNLAPVAGWAAYDAPHSQGDRAWAAYGLLLARATAPDATVAVTWAGNATYFSGRATLDQLGKTDAVIAHGPNVNPTFRPGHSKWNFTRTFRDLRPDLIAGLYYATSADLARIEEWGYTRLAGNCYVRADTRKVDLDTFRAGLLALGDDPRFAGVLCVRQDAGSAFPDAWLPDSP